jgi:hypothetical protein
VELLAAAHASNAELESLRKATEAGLTHYGAHRAEQEKKEKLATPIRPATSYAMPLPPKPDRTRSDPNRRSFTPREKPILLAPARQGDRHVSRPR